MITEKIVTAGVLAAAGALLTAGVVDVLRTEGRQEILEAAINTQVSPDGEVTFAGVPKSCIDALVKKQRGGISAEITEEGLSYTWHENFPDRYLCKAVISLDEYGVPALQGRVESVSPSLRGFYKSLCKAGGFAFT